MALLELVWRKQPCELLAASIQPSKAHCRAPTLFQRKQDKMLRICADDRADNQVTIRSIYPIPDVAKAAFLVRFEGKSKCGQVEIAEGDKVMRAWRTCTGLDRAIGGIRVQEGHPIIVGSHKLKEVEVWYSTHEELTNNRSYIGSAERCGKPSDVIKWMGSVAYRFKLSGRMKFHPTFHVSFLKSYFEKVDCGRQQVRRA